MIESNKKSHEAEAMPIPININGLFRHWIPKAENPIAELLQDSSEDYSVRWSSARVLLRHIGIAYHNRILEMAETES
ncbi:unnamed protein product, partial [marine sediment metagenome]